MLNKYTYYYCYFHLLFHVMFSKNYAGLWEPWRHICLFIISIKCSSLPVKYIFMES